MKASWGHAMNFRERVSRINQLRAFKEKEEIKMCSTFLEHKNVLTLEAAGTDNVISWEERKKQEEALTQR